MNKTIELNEEDIKKKIFTKWSGDEYQNFGFCTHFGGDDSANFFLLSQDSNIKLTKIIFEYEELK